MKVEIGNICTLKSGTSLKEAALDTKGNIPYVKVSDMNLVGNEKYIVRANTYVSDDISSKMLFPAGTVLFPKRGGAIGTNKKRIAKKTVCADLNIMGVIPSVKINPLYLYYYFQNIDFGTLYNGSSVPQINNTDIAPMEIELLSLDEQDKIINLLEKTDTIIRKRKEELASLDDLIKARFVEMFGDPYVNPKGWIECALSEKLNLVGGYAFKSDMFDENGEIPVLRIGNINTGYFKPIKLVYWQEDESLERYAMHPGDLVMSLTGTVGKDDYGNVCILGDEYEMYYLNQRNAKLEIKEGIDKFYLSQLLKFDQIKKKLTGISRGVRQANISNKDILNLVVPVPPIELQNQFAAFVNQVDKSKVVVASVK